MGYPEIILLVIYAIQGILVLKDHDMPIVRGFWTRLPFSLLNIGLLVWGGFFATWGIPQSIFGMMWAFGIGAAYLKRAEPQPVNFYGWCVAAAVLLGLFTWGGFFA